MSSKTTTTTIPPGTATPRKPVDLFALVTGILFIGFAAGALWMAFGGNPPPRALQVAVPIFLVALGTTGLLLRWGKN